MRARSPQLAYTEGWKYRTERPYTISTPLRGWSVATDWAQLLADGTLVVPRGYCWDGASGPTLDTKATMVASLVHDVFYQMMREGLLPEGIKPQADVLLGEVLRADTPARWRFLRTPRAWGWVRAVSWFGPKDGGDQRPILLAP